MDADEFETAETAASTVHRDKSLKATAGLDGSGVDWQSLWGAGSSDSGLETAADGSFLLGECCVVRCSALLLPTQQYYMLLVHTVQQVV